MPRYYLQDGDGVHVTGSEVMLVLNNGLLSLSEFDVGAVDMRFHWSEAAYPVLQDGGRFYIEVDAATADALSGSDGTGRELTNPPLSELPEPSGSPDRSPVSAGHILNPRRVQQEDIH